MVKEHIEKFKKREADTHKGDYGRVLVIAGSRGMTGAAYLTAQAALRSGSGLVTAAIPASLNNILETKLTEVITLPVPEIQSGGISHKALDILLKRAHQSDALAVGPGLGKDRSTQRLVGDILSEVEKPLVLDADGINALRGNIDILAARPHRTVITPHPGELSRLSGDSIEDIQSGREAAAKSMAQRTGAVVCLKGHATVVASPDGNLYVNKTGNSGMASGGTGDVLTGMITSFIGQGIDDVSSAISAVYLHGFAGDILLESIGPFSLAASDIIDILPEAFERSGIF